MEVYESLPLAKAQLGVWVDLARWRFGDFTVAKILESERTKVDASPSRAARRELIDVRPFWGATRTRLAPIFAPEDVQVGDWLNWTQRYNPFDRAVFQVISIEPEVETGAPVARCSIQGRHIDTWEPIDWPSWSTSCAVNLTLRHIRKLERP